MTKKTSMQIDEQERITILALLTKIVNEEDFNNLDKSNASYLRNILQGFRRY